MVRKHFPLLWFYPLTGFAFDILVSIFKRIGSSGNGWVSNLFVLTEFIILSFIYRKRVFPNDRVFFLFTGAMVVFFVSTTLNASLVRFNMFGASFFSFSYIVYGLLGFRSILKETDIVSLERYWFFWLNTAVLTYASGTFLLFLFKDYLWAVNEVFYKQLWNSLFQLLNIIKNILLAVALYHYHNLSVRARSG